MTTPETDVPLPPPTDPRPRASRRWPWIVAGAGILAALAVGAWWLIDTTVPEDAYDDAVAMLAASELDLADAQEQVTALEDANRELSDANRELSDDRTTLQADVDELTARTAALQEATDSAVVAAQALAHDSLNLGPDFAAQLEAAGVDVTDANALLTALGHDRTLHDWSISDEALFTTDRAIAAVGDDELSDAWRRWWDAAPGSPQEQAAYMEYIWRLDRLLLEALGGAQP